MNMHQRDLDAQMDADDAAALLARLRDWAARADRSDLDGVDPQLRAILPGAVPDYPALQRDYPRTFAADDSYRAGLPDLQNGPSHLVRGARREIQHVGISNFRLPIRFRIRGGGEMVLETSVTGSVSLEAEKKGINMSRLMRSFYAQAEETFSYEVMERTLDIYKQQLDSFDARLMMRFALPMKVESLRSGLAGYQYYDFAIEVIDRGDRRMRAIHLDYVYSSTCPCSLELSEHARRERGQLATPHSQRSVARISAELMPGETLWFEDLVDLCRRAVPTETQVIVKREDEQAFAELNAAHPVFVEDAARLFAQQLQADRRIGDFRVLASHQESLHSHDAVSVLTEGETFDAASLDPRLFASLVHTG